MSFAIWGKFFTMTSPDSVDCQQMQIIAGNGPQVFKPDSFWKTGTKQPGRNDWSSGLIPLGEVMDVKSSSSMHSCVMKAAAKSVSS